jgi:hypothetical protein
MYSFCDRCDRYFPHEQALEQHLAASPAHWLCEECDIDFTSAKGREQHYIQSKRHYYCRACSRHAPNAQKLLDHCRSYHYYCTSCDKFFNNQSDLDAHYRESSAHQVTKRFYCDSCNIPFASESNLRNVSLSFPLPNSSLVFTACPSPQHMKSSIHRGKNVICPWCHQAYVSQSALVLHFESGTCTSGIDRAAVNQRVREVDRNNIITDPSRLLTNGGGPQTVKHFATAASWNGRAYECYLCPKECRTLFDLNQHLASPRHESKIYICFMGNCRERFLTLSGLCQHIESEKCGALRSRVVQNALENIASGMKRLTM